MKKLMILGLLLASSPLYAQCGTGEIVHKINVPVGAHTDGGTKYVEQEICIKVYQVWGSQPAKSQLRLESYFLNEYFRDQDRLKSRLAAHAAVSPGFSKNISDPQHSCENTDGNPIVRENGEKVETQVDFVGYEVNPLAIVRNYRHFGYASNSGFGWGWSSPLLKRYQENANTGTGTADIVSLGGGLRYYLNYQGIFTMPDGTRKSIKHSNNCAPAKDNLKNCQIYSFKNEAGQYVVVSAGAQYDTFDTGGRVIRTTYATKADKIITGSNGTVIGVQMYGPYHLYAYTASGVSEVTHSSGRKLNITWANGKINTIKDHGGNTYTYSYDATGNLSSVVFPNGESRTYHYENNNNRLLTGLSLNGIRQSWYTYETPSGANTPRAVSTRNTNNINKYEFIYPPANAPSHQVYTRVINPLGLSTDYYYKGIQVEGQVYNKHYMTLTNATPSCPAAAKMRHFDVAGRLSQEDDYLGNKTNFYYDNNDQIYKEVRAEGSPESDYTEYKWDRFTGRPAAIINNGIEQRFSYDEYGYTTAVETISSSGSRKTDYFYDFHPNRLVRQVEEVTKDALGNPVSSINEYDAAGNLLRHTADAKGAAPQTTSYSQYNSLGQVGKITAADGTAKIFTYDSRGRITGLENYSASGNKDTVAFTYDRFGNIKTASYNNVLSKTYSYDEAGRLTGITNHAGSDSESVVYTLNNNGDILTTSLFKNSSRKYFIQYVYDEKGQLIESKDAAGTTLSKLGYDAQGNLVSRSKGDNHWETMRYNGMNQLKSVSIPAAGTTQFEHSALGLTKVTDALSNSTSFIRAGFGEILEEYSVAAGKSGFAYSPFNGALQKKTDAKGTVTNYAYDKLGRLNFSNNSIYQTFEYSGAGLYSAGKLTKATISHTDNIVGPLTYNYGVWGSVASQTAVIQNNAYTTSWDYDQLGRLAKITYPGGNSVAYSYNVYNKLTGLTATVAGVSSTLVSNISYLPFGGIDSFSYGNNLHRTLSFDQSYRLSKIATANVQDLTYSYSSGGLISAIANAIQPAFSQTFSYDAARRLTAESRSAGTAIYGYDELGNRTSQTIDGVSRSYTYTAGNRLSYYTQGNLTYNYQYDANGNVIAEGNPGNTQKYFGYNANNRMTTQGNHSYQYNTLGQRVYKSANGSVTHFIYSPAGELLAEGTSKQYIYLAGQPVAMISGNQIYYLHNDHLGRTEVITNQSGTVVWRAELRAFDRRVLFSTIGPFNLGFPGQYWDDEKRSWYNHFRDYDASIGRYLQTDPIGVNGGVNTYSYVQSNPVNLIDPFGLKDCTCNVKFSAVGPNQATATVGALGVKPPAGTVAINPGSFGLPYSGQITKQRYIEREATQAKIRNARDQIQILAPGLASSLSGKVSFTGTTFSIGDIGDKHIRNSPVTRMDIYGFNTLADAVNFGTATVEVTITGLPDDWACPQ